MRTTPHLTRALAALMLTLIASALVAPLALAQEDLQGTLDAYTPEDAPGGGATREWSAEWPHHPSQAEIDDAIARLSDEYIVWSANEMGEWERYDPLAVAKATPYKVHSKSGAADLGGDPATGDHLFVHYEGTLRDLGQWDDLKGGTIAPEDPQGPIDLPVNRVARLSWDKTNQRFFCDTIVPLTPVPDSIDGIYAAGYLPGWVTEGATDTEAPLPWKTVTGGLAAVLAAAAAMAGSLASASAKGQKIDPNKPIGYILDLSTPRIQLASQQSATLEVKVHRVLASGQTELMAGAPITLSAPAGVQVSPTSGAAPLIVQLWQDGEPGAGASLTVSASAEGGGTQARVELVPEATSELVLSVVPAGATLKPTGRDAVMVSAELRPSALASADPNLDLTAAKKSIAFSQPTSAEWLDVGKPTDTPAGKEMPVSLSSPDPNRQLTPPESITVSATATLGAKQLSASVTIGVEKPPVIDIRPDVFERAVDSKTSVDVFAWIENPGGAEWTFTAKWKDGDRPLALFEITPQTASTATVAVTENAGKLPDTGFAKEASTLVITGTAEGWDSLERYLKVIVAREGLFIDPTGRDPEDGSYHVLADGKGAPIDIDFRVFVRDAAGVIQRDDGLASSLEFSPTDEPGSRSRHGAEVSGLTIDFSGLRPIEPPSATWKISVKNPIPGDVPLLPVRFLVTVPGQPDEEKFAKPLILGLEPSREAPGGADWQVEYDRCKTIIFEYVPLRWQPDLTRILDRRAKHLGADGLYALRHQIWSIAQELTLGEGGEGYRDMDKWATRITTVLEYAEWAGDIAFHAATAHFIGPWAALGVAQLKQLIVSAIVAYEEDKTPDQWFWDNVGALPAILEGQAIDVDKFSKLTQNNKVKAWALFVAYHFFKSYLYNGKSFTDSLIEAGRQARDEAIAAWLGQKMKESGAPKRPEVQTPGGPKGKGTPGPSAQARARDLSARIKEATASGKKMPPEMVAEIMRDPDAARELRRADPAAYEKYANTRAEMRDAHDKQLLKTLQSRYGNKVRIQTVGTEGGIDRDYHVLIEVPTPGNKNAGMWIELPRGEWEADSYRIFAGQTNGPTGPDTPQTRADQAAHAAAHQQLATDEGHRQACADMSDTYWVKDSNGDLVAKQRTIWDPETQTNRPCTHIEMVENGQGRLYSGETTGKTYVNKVADSMKTGADGKPMPTVDAVTQAKKAGESLQGCREGYQKQGIDPGPIDPKLQQGMNIVKKGAEMGWTPEQTESALRTQAGYTGGVSEYMQAMAKGFGQLDKAK